MRATWYTSAVSGAFFAALTFIVGGDASPYANVALTAAFFLTVFFGVIGFRQFIEMQKERQRRGLGAFGVMARSSDFSEFYYPAWRRMVAWFLGAGISVLLLKVI